MKWSIKDTQWLNQMKNKHNLVSFVSEQNRQQVFSNNWRKKTTAGTINLYLSLHLLIVQAFHASCSWLSSY